jgi:hypothetical protein
VRSAIASASLGWVAIGVVIALVGLAGAAVFVQAVFDELPRRLTWWQGLGMQGANAVLPTEGSTGVSYWSVSAVGWTTYKFAERTAVMIDHPEHCRLRLRASRRNRKPARRRDGRAPHASTPSGYAANSINARSH